MGGGGDGEEEEKKIGEDKMDMKMIREYLMPHLDKMDSVEMQERRAELRKLKGHFTDKVPPDFVCPIT